MKIQSWTMEISLKLNSNKCHKTWFRNNILLIPCLKRLSLHHNWILKMLKTCFLLSRNRCRTTNKSMNSFSPYRSYKRFSTTIKQFTRMRNLSTTLSKWFWSFSPSVRTKVAPLSLLKQHSQISFTKSFLWSGKKSDSRLSFSIKISSKFSATSSKIRKAKWKNLKLVFKT